MASRRTERVGTLLQQAIATLLLRDAKDPRLASVIVTDVDMSPDLRHARVYYRLLGPDPDPERTARGLARAAGYIQSAVGRGLRLRYTPELEFVFDPTPDRARRVDELLDANAMGSEEDEGHREHGDGRDPTRR
jgi:ribosome-binding factor A